MDNILTSILAALCIFIASSIVLYCIIGSDRSSAIQSSEPAPVEPSSSLPKELSSKVSSIHKEPTVTKLDSTPHLCSIGSLIFRAAFWGFILGFLYRFIVLSPLTFGN